jgi:hypothetical protein
MTSFLPATQHFALAAEVTSFYLWLLQRRAADRAATKKSQRNSVSLPNATGILLTAINFPIVTFSILRGFIGTHRSKARKTLELSNIQNGCNSFERAQIKSVPVCYVSLRLCHSSGG